MSRVLHINPKVSNRSERRSHSESQTASERPRDITNYLGQAVLLEWLGRPPVMFHRVLVDVAGGIMNAIWLSLALDHVRAAGPDATDSEGRCTVSFHSRECLEMTGLTFLQQSTCRHRLQDAGLIEIVTPGLATAPGTYRINLHKLAEALLVQSAPIAEVLSGYEGLPGLPTGWARQA